MPERVSDSESQALDVLNPATLCVVGRVHIASADEWSRRLAAAVAAASLWQQTEAAARAQVLVNIGARIATQADSLARLHAEETGQPLAESIDTALEAASVWRYAAEATAQSDIRAGQEPAILRPRATDPLVDWAHLNARALAQGQPALVALSPLAPLTVIRAASLMGGLPASLLATLATVDDYVPAAVDGLPQLNVPPTRHGREAIFVGADADIELAVAGVTGLRLRRSGQLPFQSVRVYVEQSQIYQFADALHAAMAFLEVGDPTSARTDLGPLGSAAALERVSSQVGEALRSGLLLKLGGRRYQPWGLTGYFFQPTLLIEGRKGERSPDDQMAGPVIVLSPVRNLAEALADRPSSLPVRMHVFTRDFTSLRASLSETWQQRIATTAPGDGIDAVEFSLHQERDPRWFPYRQRVSRR